MPTEPPATPWLLSAAGAAPGEDLVGVGADLEPGTILAAYRRGLFPMGLGVGGAPPTGWWSPDPRGVLTPGQLHVSRSLHRSRAKFEIAVDTAFDAVVAGCADPNRPGAWITPEIVAAYRRLHDLGWAHSVEVWRDGDLAGGLYGLAIGSFFAAESMFHRQRDASKVAVAALVDLMSANAVPEAIPGGLDAVSGPARRRLAWMIDVQWQTPHLASLGVHEVGRQRYLELLGQLVSSPVLACWRVREGDRPAQVPESRSGDGIVQARHPR